MTSIKQIKANQQNALMSTGPKTPEGKNISSLNAVKHGIFAREAIIIAGDGREEENEYHRLLAELMIDLAPQGRMESLLVEKIAVNYWRLRRLLRYETGEVRELLDGFKKKAIDDYYDDRYSYSPGRNRVRPVMEYYDIGDEIPQEKYNEQLDRVEALNSEDFDLAKDDEALRHVFYKRIQKDGEKLTKEGLRKARVYINSLTPQLRGRLKRELKNKAERILFEMNEVRRWETTFDRIAKVYSLPREDEVNKIIKYENSLERSIFRNLAALKALQDKRQSGSKNKCDNAEVLTDESMGQ